jgi:uncharacterized protein (TIGR03083 family)
VDHQLLVQVLADESDRFAAALRDVPGDRDVPTCPEWTAADLLWHLTEVQAFWAAVAAGTVVDPADVIRPERPNDHGGLVDAFTRASADLRAAVASDPATPCWTWFEPQQHVGWVARRQAHEALIHRVDAELTAGRRVTEPDAALAADGVDEMLSVFLGEPPAWGDFHADGAAARLRASDTDDVWTVELGTLSGTSPDSGRTYTDLQAARVVDDVDHPSVALIGTAWDLDRWLWGRGDRGDLVLDGDADVAARLRTMCTFE